MGTGSKIQENPWRIKVISRAEENKSLKHELKRQKTAPKTGEKRRLLQKDGSQSKA